MSIVEDLQMEEWRRMNTEKLDALDEQCERMGPVDIDEFEAQLDAEFARAETEGPSEPATMLERLLEENIRMMHELSDNKASHLRTLIENGKTIYALNEEITRMNAELTQTRMDAAEFEHEAMVYARLLARSTFIDNGQREGGG